MVEASSRSPAGASSDSSWSTRIPLWLPAVGCTLLAVATVPARPWWNDEAFTAYAVTLRWPDFVGLLHQADAVHALYYLLLRGWTAVAGTSLTALRLPSVIFMGLACLAVTLIGRDLGNRRIAVLAGSVFALIPAAATFGSEARSLALATAAVTWATWAMVRAQAEPAGPSIRKAWRRWAPYVALLVLSGYVFLLAVLVLIPHVGLLLHDRRRGHSPWPALTAQAGALVLLMPVLVVGFQQRQQVSWIEHDPAAELSWLAAYPLADIAPVRVGVAVACWTVCLVGCVAIARSRSGAERSLLVLAGAWALGPGLALIAVSSVSPMFVSRYLTFCTPGFALLLALAITRLRGVWPTVLSITVLGVLAGLATHPVARGGYDEWRAKEALLRREASPGDAVLASARWYEVVPRFASLPAGVAVLELPDSLRDSRDTQAHLSLTDRPPTIWVLGNDVPDPQDPAWVLLRDAGYRRTEAYPVGEDSVVLRYDLSTRGSSR